MERRIGVIKATQVAFKREDSRFVIRIDYCSSSIVIVINLKLAIHRSIVSCYHSARAIIIVIISSIESRPHRLPLFSPLFIAPLIVSSPSSLSITFYTKTEKQVINTTHFEPRYRNLRLHLPCSTKASPLFGRRCNCNSHHNSCLIRRLSLVNLSFGFWADSHLESFLFPVSVPWGRSACLAKLQLLFFLFPQHRLSAIVLN